MSIAAEIAKSIARKTASTASSSRVFAHLTPAVYADLRRLARCFMSSERGGHTLQPTAVVNEAFLRLSISELPLKDEKHLFRLAAQTMRRVLIDHARERRRMKRQTQRESAESGATMQHYAPPTPLDLLDIDAALEELAAQVPRAATLLELRYFAGLSDIEISELFGVSRPTIEREFRFAKAFLVAYAKRQRATL